MMNKSVNRKGALELSIGTIVIIVIGMSMLILGLVLVQTIFSGSKYNVEQLNEKVKGEIGKLFEEESRSVVYLANHEARVKQGDIFGVAFAFKNLETGTTKAGQFTYEVKAAAIGDSCKGLTPQIAESWIKSRANGDTSLPPGETYYIIARFEVSETAPLCIVPYDIIVKKDGEVYVTDFFDLNIEG